MIMSTFRVRGSTSNIIRRLQLTKKNQKKPDSAALVDLLTNAGVSPDKMEVRWFTDSDHSIKFHGATTFLYKQLTKKLYEEKNRGRGRKHQWSRRWS